MNDRVKEPLEVSRSLVINSLLSVRRVGNSTDVKYVRSVLPQICRFCPVDFRVNLSLKDHARKMIMRGKVRSLEALFKNIQKTIPRYAGGDREADLDYGYGCMGLQKRRQPFVYHETFCPIEFGSEKEQSAFDRSLSKHVDAVQAARIIFTPLNVSAEMFSRRFPSRSADIRIVPFFMPHLDPLLSRERDPVIERGMVSVLFVGGDGRRKGLVELLAAWEMLSADVRKVARLHVVSEMRDGLISIPPGVTAEGFNPNPSDLFRSSDIFVLPTRRDSYGFVLCEAMAAGCAIITSDDPVRREICADAARYVPIRDAVALANSITELVVDREQRNALGTLARDRARQVFAPSKVAMQHFHAFREALC